MPTIESKTQSTVQEKATEKRDKQFMDQVNSFVDQEIGVQKKKLDSKVQTRVNASLSQYKKNMGPEVEKVVSKKFDKKPLVPVVKSTLKS